MQLIEVLQQINQQSMKAAGLTDLFIGTVASTSPLSVTIDTLMQPLQEQVLYLTSAVVEKKIPILTHAHTTDGFAHSHTINTLSHDHTTSGSNTGDGLTGSYQTEEALSQDAFTSDQQLENIVCYENGTALPVQNGYIILNRALATGDKVLLLRVQSGQKFIILSRVMGGGNA